MEKILTVSIAAYNVEKYLEQTLNSFVNEEWMDAIEVLIVSDGSTDSTPTIAKRYVDKYPGTFILIEKENGGWGSTVNTGISHATGKYFKLLDGDDYFENTGDLLAVLKDTQADLVYTQFKTFYEDSDETKISEFEKNVPLNEVVDLKADYVKTYFAMHSCAFKTALLKDAIQITEHCFYTDVEYILKSVVHVKSVMFVPSYVYCYRMGRVGQSASKEGCRKHYLEHLKVLNLLLGVYSSLDEGEVKEIYFNRLCELVDQQYYIFLILEPTSEHERELKDFDLRIKKDFPMFYPTNRNRIKAYRILGKMIYKMIVY